MDMHTIHEALQPDLLERKGSLLLRSNHMHYGRPILVSGWHESREAEPKEYDVAAAPFCEKDLCQSTYKRFGDVEDEVWNTTTKEHLSQLNLKEDYKVQELPKLMVNEDNINTVNFERETGCPERGFGSAMPMHSLDHGAMNLETTYGIDYIFPYQCTVTGLPDTPDYSAAYKKCHSQFTDTADYRRLGRNTWQNESGIYANSQIKEKVFKPTCPITPHL
ncbi:cilia- and flagella-associated protein 95 [Discoglossus pictus]